MTGRVALPGGGGHGTDKSVRPAADFELALTLREEDDSLRGFLQYSTDLFEPVTADRLIGYFQTLLVGILENPQRRVSELPLAGEDELRRVLVGWNATAADYRLDRCVHELIAGQAERTPDAIAVAHDGRTWTYRELNERADRLAGELRALGGRRTRWRWRTPSARTSLHSIDTNPAAG